MSRFHPLALLALLAAPLFAVAQPGPGIVTLDDPAEAFHRVERFVLYSQHVAMDQVFIEADSAFKAELVGRWRLGPQNRADIHVAGIFYDFNLNSEPFLLSDGTRMVGGRSEDVRFDTTTAPALRDALAIGFMRMGLLHNLVRLHTGTPPDHADGGVEDWVTVHDFAWLPEQRMRDRMVRPLTFTIRVDGTDSAEATLFIDTVTGLPLRRQQTVAFGSSAMTVEENYFAWSIIARLDGADTKTFPDESEPPSEPPANEPPDGGPEDGQ